MYGNAGICCDQKTIEPQRDTPEVLRALNELRQVVEEQYELIGRIVDRLQWILSPEQPIVTKNKVTEKIYGTALASNIHEVEMRIQDHMSVLEFMYNRIEL